MGAVGGCPGGGAWGEGAWGDGAGGGAAGGAAMAAGAGGSTAALSGRSTSLPRLRPNRLRRDERPASTLKAFITPAKVGSAGCRRSSSGPELIAWPLSAYPPHRPWSPDARPARREPTQRAGAVTSDRSQARSQDIHLLPADRWLR